MSTDPNRLERRGAQRFELHLPLAVHVDGRTVPGFTQDLSGRGIFFYAETSLPQGTIVELTFTMPSESPWEKICPSVAVDTSCALQHRQPLNATGSLYNSIPTSTCPPANQSLNSYEFQPLRQVRVNYHSAESVISPQSKTRPGLVPLVPSLFKRWPLPYNQGSQQSGGWFRPGLRPAGNLPFVCGSPSITKVIWPRRWKFVA